MVRTSNNEDNAPRRSWRPVRSGAALLLLLVLTGTACEEVNDLTVDVGTAILVLTDPDLEPQGTADSQKRIQVAEWTLGGAELFLEDAPTTGRDLLFNQPCRFTETAVRSTTSTDKCASGIVLGVGDGSPISASIQLRFVMAMRRGRPKELIPTDDTDGDEIPNERDLCPLVSDNKEDINRNGIGDACETRSADGALSGGSDLDGDGTADGLDNCLWDANPGQEDTRGVSADGIPDGIGDACIEQLATVQDSAGMESKWIEVTLPLGEITDLATSIAFLVVDFRSSQSVECDWDSKICLLDTTKIKACANSRPTSCT